MRTQIGRILRPLGEEVFMPYRFAFTVAFLLLVAPRLAHGAPQLPYSVERCPVAGVDLDRSAAPVGQTSIQTRSVMR